MGWQDRDWAKLSDEELNAIYGGGARREAGCSTTASRGIMWCAISILVVVLAGTYVLNRPAASSPPLVQARGLIYGRAITFHGEATACTESAYNTAIHGWVCLAVEENFAHLPVVEPRPYDGPCADAIADQTEGRWVCRGYTPLPPSTLPSEPRL